MFKLVTTLIIIAASLVAGQVYVIGFDDTTEDPRGTGSPIDIYKGLNFTDFYTHDPHNPTGIVPYGLQPTSGKNVAIYFTSKTKGVPHPSIKVHYKDSMTTSLDFKSFEFGCVTGRNGVAYGIARCIVAVFGYKAGQRVASQSFSFLPTNRATTASMVSAVLSSDFQGLDTVRFATIYAPTVEIMSQKSGFTGSTWFDDLKFTLYKGSANANTPLTTDSRCGPIFSERCPADLCCSSTGSCGPFGGLDPAPWCAPENCIPGWGKCDTATSS